MEKAFGRETGTAASSSGSSTENFTYIPNGEQTAITHWSLPETIRVCGLFPMNVFNNFARFKSSDTSMTEKRPAFIQLSKSPNDSPSSRNSIIVHGTMSLHKLSLTCTLRYVHFRTLLELSTEENKHTQK